MCVVNSLGNPHPVAMVWATAESFFAMTLLADELSRHLQENGCTSDPFSVRLHAQHVDPRDLCYQPDWEDPLPGNYACAPPYRLFVKSVLDGEPNNAYLPQLDDRPTFLSDGGLAFRSFAECLGWRHVLCKKHLSANNSLSSTTHECVTHCIVHRQSCVTSFSVNWPKWRHLFCGIKCQPPGAGEFFSLVSNRSTMCHIML